MWNNAILYDESLNGGKLVADSNDAIYYTKLASFGNSSASLGWNAKKNDYVILSGYYTFMNDGSGIVNIYQSRSGVWVIPEEGGWKATTKLAPKTYSQTQAQALVDKIIKNNIAITQNNLVCARYASRFSPEQQQMIRDLQTRVVARENALKNEGLCTDIQTSFPRGYVELEPYLAALMNGQAIGLATWAICVIAASVILVTSTAAYFAYKAFANESESDVKYSKELTKTLTEKLTEEEYQQLLNETKGIVTKSRLKQAISSYGNIAKWALFGIAGFAIYKVIMNKWKGARE